MKNETIKILFVSSKDTWREHQMYLKVKTILPWLLVKQTN